MLLVDALQAQPQSPPSPIQWQSAWHPRRFSSSQICHLARQKRQITYHENERKGSTNPSSRHTLAPVPESEEKRRAWEERGAVAVEGLVKIRPAQSEAASPLDWRRRRRRVLDLSGYGIWRFLHNIVRCCVLFSGRPLFRFRVWPVSLTIFDTIAKKPTKCIIYVIMENYSTRIDDSSWFSAIL